jgi:glycerol-3-phosphate dehydrogenase
MNLVLDAPEWLRDGVAIGFRHPDEGRAVFVVPWRGRCIVGTYCRDYPFDPSQALRVEASWIEAFLRWLAPVHRDWTGLRREDVRFVHAGLVPRAPGSRPEPADHPRIERCPDGIVDVQGVKWTTAYGVSCRAVDLAEQALGRSGRATLGPLEALPDPRALLRAYLDRHPELDVPLLADRAHPTRGEVCFAVDCQWARDLGDVLLRRTDLASSGHPGTRVVSAVAEALQRRLGWSERERQDQLETFDADFHFAGNAPPS